MNGIEKEIRFLQALASGGSLPGYPDHGSDSSYVTEAPAPGLTVYNSGELADLERQLQTLWPADDPLRACIPALLAAVEKSKDREAHCVEQTELYNYTM